MSWAQDKLYEIAAARVEASMDATDRLDCLDAQSIGERPAEKLDAFDREGKIVGHARPLRSGRWSVTLAVETEEEARILLEEFGAKQFVKAVGAK